MGEAKACGVEWLTELATRCLTLKYLYCLPIVMATAGGITLAGYGNGLRLPIVGRLSRMFPYSSTPPRQRGGK